MKNLKKVIALVAVLAMVLSTVALGATYTDVADDSAYSVAVESLSKLGIVTGYEDGTYGPEKSVTRAEMAALIARIQGYGETAKAQTNTAFADVPSSHWASGYVAYAANQNIVNGYGDGTFGPDDTVKYEQAVTMIMRTLGFEYFATTNGGYPTGYLAAAQRYGLTNGVSNAVVGSEANRGTIAQLLYNGIDTPIMAPYKWNTNGEVEYAVYDGVDAAYKTLMSENLGVIKIKGLVTENVTTALDDKTKAIDLGKDAAVKVMLIDTFDSNHPDFDEYAEMSITEMEDAEVEVEFLVGDSDIDEFLGNRVVLYAIEDKNTDKFVVVSAALDSTTNKTAEFTLEQYAKLITGAKTKIAYFKNATDKDATELVVDADADVIYNNVGGYTIGEIFGSVVAANSVYGGKVALVDNDSKNGYDVIYVEVGATAVVDEVNGSKVSFKENAVLAMGGSISAIKVDEEAEDEIFAFVKDGEVIDVADLKEWDVLTIVAADKNADFIYAEVINSTVSGVVAATAASNTSDTTFKYTIAGNKYDVAAGNYKAGNLAVGDAGIFYIDKYGKIAAFSEDSSVEGGAAATYGFVLYAAKNTGGLSTNVLQIKMITANGVEDFACASKVKYYKNDQSVATVDGDSIAKVAFLNTNRYELIKYTTNAAGEINAIYEAGYDADKFVKKADVVSGTDKYDADNFKLYRALDEDATVFLLSTTPTLTAPVASHGDNDYIMTIDGNYYKINPSNCIMGTLADLIDDEVYRAKIYADHKGVDGNLIVLTTGYGATAASSTIAVISDVATAVNDDFEECYILNFYADGELKEGVYTTNEAFISAATLTEGDIVKVNVASNGVITAITSLVDFAPAIRNAAGLQLEVNNVGTFGSAPDLYAFNYATSYNKTNKAATISGTSYRLSNAKNVYVIDASLKAGRIEVGSAIDFAWDKEVISAADRAKYADYVLVREYDGRVEDVVIIKGWDYKNVTLDTEASLAADAAADALAAYETAKADAAAKKADYETAKAAYNAAPDATLAAAANAAIDDYQDAAAAAKTAADAAKTAADAAKVLDAEFDMTSYTTAVTEATTEKAAADALVDADGTNPLA